MISPRPSGVVNLGSDPPLHAVPTVRPPDPFLLPQRNGPSTTPPPFGAPELGRGGEQRLRSTIVGNR